MFVRKKKNRSGTYSVVVADKSSGKFRELHTISISSGPREIEELIRKGYDCIDRRIGRMRLDFDGE